MAKCPKCGAEITYLKDYSEGETLYEFSIDSKGQPDYNEIDVIPTSKSDEYECPECSEVLFYDEEEAVKFLKGE